MIKVLNQYFAGRLFVLLVTENMLILLGIWAGVSYQMSGRSMSVLAYPALFGKAFLVTVICQVCLYYADIYDLRTISSRIEVLMRVMQALGAAALILAALFYFVPDTRLGAGIVETSLLGIVLVILLWRIFIEWLNRAYGAGERILLIGSGASVYALTRELRNRPDLPISVIGSVSESEAGSAFAGIPMLGSLNDLGRIISETKPSRLIVALKERRQ